MKEIVCSFCGHRDCGEELRSEIKEKIKALTDEHSVNVFYSGGMGDFDKMCESVVRAIKRENSKIRLCLILPYMTKSLNKDREYYEQMYDEIIIPDLGEVHYKRAIPERNKWIVKHSEYMLCYVKRSYGGAYTTYKYAVKEKVKLIEL